MTYTTQQLQAMTDHEINCALAVKLNADHYTATGLLFTAKKHDGDNVVSVSGVTDYCNNPNDIMPLAFERGIGIEKNPLRIEWISRTCEVNMSNKQFRCFIDKNPLRAIACLILMMDE